MTETKGKEKPVFDAIIRELGRLGIDLDELEWKNEDEIKVRAICVVPDIGESVKELGQSPRDNVVMVRVDSESARSLDRWVESGAVKSRSEASALFIKEGLKLHSKDLDKLDDALTEVDRAREKLKQKVKEVLESQAAPTEEKPNG
jgi:hypothetical protein